MAKITRVNGNVKAFGSAQGSGERTLFGQAAVSDDLTAQFTAEFLRGWGIVGASDFPKLQDFNAATYTNGQLLAYLHQMGIAEYNSAQEFYSGSVTQYGGQIYMSIQDGNTGRQPNTNPVWWRNVTPQATEAIAGIARISETSMATSGADDTTMMTPLKTKAAIVDDQTHIKGDACSFAGFLGGVIGGTPYFRHFPSDTIVSLARATDLEALLPKRSFFVNDFIRIPDRAGGLMVQFGVTGAVAGSGGSIFQTFPTPFPTKVNTVLISLNTASGDSTSTPSWVRDKSVNGFTPVNQNVLPATFSWIAIGN